MDRSAYLQDVLNLSMKLDSSEEGGVGSTGLSDEADGSAYLQDVLYSFVQVDPGQRGENIPLAWTVTLPCLRLCA